MATSTKKWLQTVTTRVTKLEHMGYGCMSEEPYCLNIHKDLVSRGYLVASKCDPSKPVMTNEHKQLMSYNMNKFIHGQQNQISVIGNNDGSVTIGLAQEQVLPQEPTFKSIKLYSDPKEATDVATKEYVDKTVSNALPALNACSQISVINPNGDCLRIGRNDKTFIDINVEENGTLNLTNEKPDGKINDIDIYGERINLLSNLNTTSPNTGSVVVYGGMGIMKDLQIGGNLYLKTYNGIPSKLDFFEEGVLPVIWSGIWENDIDTSIIYQRIGGCVTLMVPYTCGRSTKSDVITNTVETYLPERLRPIYDIKPHIDTIYDDIETDGYAKIFGDNGKIIIYPKISSTFSEEGMCGFQTFSVNYMVDTKKETLEEDNQV